MESPENQKQVFRQLLFLPEGISIFLTRFDCCPYINGKNPGEAKPPHLS